MMQKIVLILFVLSGLLHAMQKDEVVGTLLLTGSYYCGIEYFRQQYAGHPTNEERLKFEDRWFCAAAVLHASGFVALLNPLELSATPIKTFGKFSLGAMSLAEAAYLLKCAKMHHNQFLLHHLPRYKKARDACICGSLLVAAFGSSMVTWAMADTKQ